MAQSAHTQHVIVRRLPGRGAVVRAALWFCSEGAPALLDPAGRPSGAP